MIKNRLKIVVAERDLNYSKLTKAPGICFNALLKMRKNPGISGKADCDVLRRLCVAVGYIVGDLLYISRKKTELVAQTKSRN